MKNPPTSSFLLHFSCKPVSFRNIHKTFFLFSAESFVGELSYHVGHHLQSPAPAAPGHAQQDRLEQDTGLQDRRRVEEQLTLGVSPSSCQDRRVEHCSSVGCSKCDYVLHVLRNVHFSKMTENHECSEGKEEEKTIFLPTIQLSKGSFLFCFSFFRQYLFHDFVLFLSFGVCRV